MDLDFSSPSKDARSLALLLRGPGGLLGDAEQLFEAAVEAAGSRCAPAKLTYPVRCKRTDAKRFSTPAALPPPPKAAASFFPPETLPVNNLRQNLENRCDGDLE
mmetsp:Transcript_9902/g.19441  ORF Transcript_9902/g.19441 Transcript_9902/m.19441 type:complete len:104 (-) Transcript_9902:29-340(-)